MSAVKKEIIINRLLTFSTVMNTAKESPAIYYKSSEISQNVDPYSCFLFLGGVLQDIYVVCCEYCDDSIHLINAFTHYDYVNKKFKCGSELSYLIIGHRMNIDLINTRGSISPIIKFFSTCPQ